MDTAIRTQIYLGAEQTRRISRIAKARSCNKSEVIREALDQYFARQDPVDRRKRLLSLAGALGDNAYQGFDLRTLRNEERSF